VSAFQLKVLVVNMPGIKIEENGHIRHFVKAGSRWPMTIGYSKSVAYYPYPFWLGYTSSILKRDTPAAVKGIDGVVMDMTPEEFLSIIEREHPNLLLAELATLTIYDDLKLLNQVKLSTGAKIVVCGSFVTALHQEVMVNHPYVDYALIGEYELTARDLVNCLVEDKGLSNVSGLVYRKDGGVKVNVRGPLISDLDTLPYPDRDDFPAARYSDFAVTNFPCIQMISSRGCPFGCIFCLERHVIYASSAYRMRNPKNVVDEMELCISRYGAKQIYFDDQSFTVNKKYAMALCNEIIQRKLNIPWTCMADAIVADFEILEKMSKAGCVGIKFGVESADPNILKTIGKPLKLERIKRIVEWCRKLGIRTHATFCIGLPGDNRTTIKNSLIFAKKLGSDTIQVSMAVPYPGTPFFEWAEKEGYIITNNWCKYDGTQHAVLSYPELSNAELEELYREFLKTISRKKVYAFASHPLATAHIILGVYRQRGLRGILDATKTTVENAL